MLVDIDNDPDNWKKWGELVRSWVFKPKPRPNDVGELRAQMLTAVITGTVTGPATKKIEFITNTYSGGGPLKIPLPTKAKVTAAETNLAAIAAGAAGLPVLSTIPFRRSTLLPVPRSISAQPKCSPWDCDASVNT